MVKAVSKEAEASGRNHEKSIFTKVGFPYAFGFEDQVCNAVSFRSYQQLLLADN